jgi:hypothetical protein
LEKVRSISGGIFETGEKAKKKKADNYYEKSVEKVFGENSEATSKTIMKVRSQKP